ncbi:MAG: hypothetical protein GWM98_11085 [Nitrospinaceae bacterium]|nr:sulfurtransferase [Nitrospinaceae bacterium]NIR54940.1 sulfurtransferase [Nitrospinaceae bacterium]NIT82182.1 sulfurtransferase [Nitrospinaceae bacterium]NIY15395.1 hypothetical protein [Nitrospinaceae bacterium]
MSSKIKPFILTVFLFLGAFTGVPSLAFSGYEFEPLITAQKLNSIPLKKVVILDTRSSWKFLMGHIPGAIHLGDWRDFTLQTGKVPGRLNRNKAFIAERLRALGIRSRKTLVIYGDPLDKWRTDGRFFWMFKYFGFKRTAILQGGLPQWEKAGFEIERGPGRKIYPSKLQPDKLKFREEYFADQKWIAQRLGSPEIALIDNREKHEFEGATPYGSPRGGHIPGAIHIDWREFFRQDGTVKNRKQLKALLQTYSIREDQEIVVYCTGGVRSAMAFFVFHYLGYQVRNYDGSWWDWSHSPHLPIKS